MSTIKCIMPDRYKNHQIINVLDMVVKEKYLIEIGCCIFGYFYFHMFEDTSVLVTVIENAIADLYFQFVEYFGLNNRSLGLHLVA